MRISRYFHWRAARAYVVVAAVVGMLLLISGAANAASRAAFQPSDVIAPAATSTTLTTSPVSPVTQGTMVTLTATVVPATAAGTVQFKDGTADLGIPVTVSNGSASGSTSKLVAGSRQLAAVFTPSDLAAFSPSTSLPVTFMVTGPTATKTTLTTSPGSSVTPVTPVTLVATVTPATAAGTVQFKDGTANLGDPVTVANGTASETRLISTVGSRQLTAVFTPANPATFSPSTSSAVSLTVTESPQSATIATQQSGQSLDGSAGAQGLTVLDLGGLADGRGVTLLDGGGVSDGRGVTLLDGAGAGTGRGVTLLDLGGLTDGRGLTVLDGRRLTVLRDGGSGGLLSNLLRGLL